MSEMENLINKYFRPGRLPHIWCPGCGNGVITGAIVKAIDKQGLAKDDVAVISGIGCVPPVIWTSTPPTLCTAVLCRLLPV